MNITPAERIDNILEFKESDRVPFSLGLMLHGAKLLNIPIEQYFSKPENIVKSQIHLREKFDYDVLSAYFSAATEYSAWGGDIIYFEEGPPNAGRPIIQNREQIKDLQAPEIYESPGLEKILTATTLMREEVGDSIPILGVVMSPFSIPIMQMSFSKYLELIYENRELFDILINVNKQFCIKWANAQLEQGADVITYYDPMSSSTIIPRELYLETGHVIAKEVIKKIKGDVAIHFASARTEAILEDVLETDITAIGVSSMDDLGKIKSKCQDKVSIIGNLNGIEMINWTPKKAEMEVKRAIAQAAKGGGFILSDTHGEIPYQVDIDVLFAIAEAVKKWGKYPLNWIEDE